MDQRVQFIADDQRDVFDVADLALRYGISRKTAYKWIDRYDAGSPAGLVDRSRRPAHSRQETSALIVAALLEVRQHHPTWGAKKLLKMVATRQPTWRLPARSTVCDLLDRAGLITTSRRRPVPAHPGRPLVPMTTPNGYVDGRLQRPVQSPSARVQRRAPARSPGSGDARLVLSAVGARAATGARAP